MVCRSNNGDQDDSRVSNAQEDAEHTAGRRETHAQTHGESNGAGSAVLRSQGNRHYGEADEERVPEMQRRHGGILVTELVLRPYTAFALGAVNSVDETVATRFFAYGTGNFGVGQKTRRHAWPQGENDECNQIACSHRSAPGSIQHWTCWATICLAHWLVVEWKIDSVARCGIVEEPYQEQDCTWDMDEGVCTVCPVEEEGVFQEPRLNVEFKENV